MDTHTMYPQAVQTRQIKNIQLIYLNCGRKKTYSFDEAQDATLKYFNGDELAARVWVTKYALKDSFGNIYEKNSGRYASSHR